MTFALYSIVRMKFAFQKADALYVLEIPRREKRQRAVSALFILMEVGDLGGAYAKRKGGGTLTLAVRIPALRV